MRRGRAWLVVAQIAAATVVLSAANEVIRLQPIPTEGRVKVTFTARDAWTLASRDVLQNGLELRYEYVIELKKAAPVWFLPDGVFARAGVSALASLDRLRGDYRASRMR